MNYGSDINQMFKNRTEFTISTGHHFDGLCLPSVLSNKINWVLVQFLVDIRLQNVD